MKQNNNNVFIYAHNKQWGLTSFDELVKNNDECWLFVDNAESLKDRLSDEVIAIFFVHWSEIVPKYITDKFECVCFHMTDLPYGRGGSPLQNLILNGHKDTKLCALKMTQKVDAGPIYKKWPLSLEGTAQSIYERVSLLANTAIREIVDQSIQPVEQSGHTTFFKRRSNADSELPKNLSLQQQYDFIRMLDAKGYPNAFIKLNNGKVSFSNAKIINNKLTAMATFEGCE